MPHDPRTIALAAAWCEAESLRSFAEHDGATQEMLCRVASHAQGHLKSLGYKIVRNDLPRAEVVLNDE